LVRQANPRFPHIKFFSQKDQGIYDAMNNGLAWASGDYVIFLGADDRFADADVLAKFVAALGEERPDVAYGSIVAVGTGLRNTPDGGIYGGEFDLPLLLQKNICHQAIFYSRSIIAKAGPYNIRYRYYADWDYNLRCYSLGSFKYIDLVVARYNTTGRSTSGQDYVFHVSFFKEVHRYFGISLFSRHFREMADYMGFSGKVRILVMKDFGGFFYLFAACWHSPSYFFELFVSAVCRCIGYRRVPVPAPAPEH
jgi:glycosyltransferase involved in cell wall biosynthesis